jgi:hypothetical protein
LVGVRRGETAGETIEVVVAPRYGGVSRRFHRRGHGCVKLDEFGWSFKSVTIEKAALIARPSPSTAFPLAAPEL